MSESAKKAHVMPFEHTAATKFFATRLQEVLTVESISQRDIAGEAGYTKPNIFSMFKSGETKIPIDRIPAMAKALRTDVAHFARLVLLQHYPTLGPEFEEIFGAMPSKTEKLVLTTWRKINGADNIDMDAQAKTELKEALKAVHAGLVARHQAEVARQMKEKRDREEKTRARA